MTSAQIRQSFLDFFKSKQHSIVPSSSLMPDSPNLLFTNAGMNQFVPIFLGQVKCPYTPGRAADTQKCIRAGGKHNDLDDVGLDTYHHTFFEMLGNWSFGDYFKKEAIEWAWELVVGIWKFPPQRLYATVYNPDKSKNDPSEFDQEAWNFWAEKFRSVGLDPAVHIVNGNKKDNFWMMGDTGPCGPCSELHVDLTPAGDTRGALVNKGDARCIEIWNLVFIQFNANPDGTFSPLPAKHVDTGMGFERVTSIIQGTKGFTDFKHAKISNYETDIFRPIFDAIEKMSGKKYTSTLPRSAGFQPAATSEPASGPLKTVGEAPGGIVEVSKDDCATASTSTLPTQNVPPLPSHGSAGLQPASTPAQFNASGTFEAGSGLKGRAPESQEQIQIDIAFRVIADHIRTLSFAIADGIQPGNNDRNYVLRRILRRAVRYGRTLGFHEPFFYKLVDVLAQTMGDVFPEIRTRKTQVQETIRTEEEAFNKTLDSGIEVFETALRRRGDLLEVCTKIEPKVDSLRKLFTAMEKEPIDEFLPKAKADVESVAAETPRLDHNDFWLIFGRQGISLLGLGQMLAKFYAPDFKEKEENEAKFYVHGILTNLGLGIETAKSITKGVSGRTAFTLYDTYGFPLDLTELMARERGLSVDTAGFEKLMDEQRARARAAQKKEVISLSQIETTTPTKFVGFDTLETKATVLEVVGVKDKTAVVLDTSSAYAEMGGQVGDTGELSSGSQLWRVVNTQKSGNTWLHFIQERVEQATSLSRRATSPAERGGALESSSAPEQAGITPIPPGRLPGGTGESPVLPIVGSEVILTVDKPRRDAIQRHHTVTHLLHWALHEVVSKEASQKGSFVGPDKLTFDFNAQPLTPQQVTDIEKLVNERVLENAGVSWTEVPYADVKSRKDVMQFFGDKYGDTVRVVQIGGHAKQLDGYSMELCGGTHTRATGEIGLFRIVSENAIAAGVRRIEAVAGLNAYDVANQQLQLIRSIAGKINSPVHELEKKVEALFAHQKELEKQLKSAAQREAAGRAKDLVMKVKTINGTPALIENVGAADGDTVQTIVDALKVSFKGVIVLGAANNGVVTLIASVAPEFTAKVQAGKIIQTIAPIVGGKGGGKPDNARGGGKDASKLDEALSKATQLL
jgi:alanyl-tRNA synthetase